MKRTIVGIWNSTQGKYVEATPWVYYNNVWEQPITYAYDNSQWKLVGGAQTLMIPFIVVSNEWFYTSDGKVFQVREHE